MIPDGYRILLSYQNEKERFIARIPELDVSAEASTRAEALAKAEEALETAFRKAAEDGTEMPPPIDDSEFSGKLEIQVSPSLHRELTFLASQEGVEFNQIASEILSSAVASRTKSRQRPQQPAREGNAQRERTDDHHRPHRRGNQYFNIMDDRAQFLEYVRGLDGAGSGHRGGRGRNRR
jgi:predicted HicB family RNase H-like nuclease